MKPRIASTVVAVLAFIAGISVSFFTLPLWVTTTTNIAKEGSRTDWLGFTGNVIAGVMTLIGATVAWFAVQQQIRAQKEVFDQENEDKRSARAENQTNAKRSAVTALANITEAAGMLFYVVRKAKEATDTAEIAEWDRTVREACDVLAETLDHFSLRELSLEMNVKDRLGYLSLLSSLATFVTVIRRKPTIVSRETLLKSLEKHLGELRKNDLLEFDSELANKFDSASKQQP